MPHLLKRKLTFVPVKTMDEVLSQAMVRPRGKHR